MHNRYVAYGLQLHCSFPLPGMARHAVKGLPDVTVELGSDAQLDLRWPMHDGPVRWRGQLGDGCELTIAQAPAGEILFTYGSRARFLLAGDRRQLLCAPVEPESLPWQQVLLARILPNVSLANGYEALHASAVQSPHGVVAVAAPSGMGKTTLAVELMRRGWPLCADDVLVLGNDSAGVRAHHGTPNMNLAGEPPRGLATTLGTLAGERWVSAHNATRERLPVRMVCLFERAPGLSLDCTALPASPLPLAPYMLGLLGDAERERRRFSLYADLMAEARLARLTGGPADGARELADALEASLAEGPA